jgi:uncharacterized glyoxalase superfamily protein PhnB
MARDTMRALHFYTQQRKLKPMTTQSTCCPEGVTWVSPYITVKDVDTAITFYQKAFNFDKKEAVPGEDGTTWHAEMKYKNQLLMFGKAGAYDKKSQAPQTSKVECPMSLYLYCENVDQFYEDAIAAGAKSIIEPQDMFWGDRMCKLQCPDGYHWAFATHIKK